MPGEAEKATDPTSVHGSRSPGASGSMPASTNSKPGTAQDPEQHVHVAEDMIDGPAEHEQEVHPTAAPLEAGTGEAVKGKGKQQKTPDARTARKYAAADICGGRGAAAAEEDPVAPAAVVQHRLPAAREHPGEPALGPQSTIIFDAVDAHSPGPREEAGAGSLLNQLQPESPRGAAAVTRTSRGENDAPETSPAVGTLTEGPYTGRKSPGTAVAMQGSPRAENGPPHHPTGRRRRRQTLDAGGGSDASAAAEDRAVTRRRGARGAGSCARGPTTSPSATAAPASKKSAGKKYTGMATTTVVPVPAASTRSRSSSTTTTTSRRGCLCQPCNETSVCFGFPGGKRTSCGQHRQYGMVNLNNSHNAAAAAAADLSGEGGHGRARLTTGRKRTIRDGVGGGGGGGGCAGVPGNAPAPIPASTGPQRRRIASEAGKTAGGRCERGPSSPCPKPASFGFPGGRREACFAHRSQGMVNLVLASVKRSSQRKAHAAAAAAAATRTPTVSSVKGQQRRANQPRTAKAMPRSAMLGGVSFRSVEKASGGGGRRVGGLVLKSRTRSGGLKKGGGGGGAGGAGSLLLKTRTRGGGLRKDVEAVNPATAAAAKAGGGNGGGGGAGEPRKQPAGAANVKRRRRSKEESAAGGTTSSPKQARGVSRLVKQPAAVNVKPCRRSKEQLTAAALALAPKGPRGGARGKARRDSEGGTPVASKLCRLPACGLHASFGFLTEGAPHKREYCLEHALPGMVNLVVVGKKARLAAAAAPAAAPAPAAAAAGAGVRAARRRGGPAKAARQHPEKEPAPPGGGGGDGGGAGKKRGRPSKVPRSAGATSPTLPVGDGQCAVTPSGLIRSPVYRSAASVLRQNEDLVKKGKGKGKKGKGSGKKAAGSGGGGGGGGSRMAAFQPGDLVDDSGVREEEEEEGKGRKGRKRKKTAAAPRSPAPAAAKRARPAAVAAVAAATARAATAKTRRPTGADKLKMPPKAKTKAAMAAVATTAATAGRAEAGDGGSTRSPDRGKGKRRVGGTKEATAGESRGQHPRKKPRLSAVGGGGGGGGGDGGGGSGSGSGSGKGGSAVAAGDRGGSRHRVWEGGAKCGLCGRKAKLACSSVSCFECCLKSGKPCEAHARQAERKHREDQLLGAPTPTLDGGGGRGGGGTGGGGFAALPGGGSREDGIRRRLPAGAFKEASFQATGETATLWCLKDFVCGKETQPAMEALCRTQRHRAGRSASRRGRRSAAADALHRRRYSSVPRPSSFSSSSSTTTAQRRAPSAAAAAASFSCTHAEGAGSAPASPPASAPASESASEPGCGSGASTHSFGATGEGAPPNGEGQGRAGPVVGGGGAAMEVEAEDARALRVAAVGVRWRRKHAQLLEAVG